MTGIYKVEWQVYFEDTGSASVNNTNIYGTTNNSDYTILSSSVNSNPTFLPNSSVIVLPKVVGFS